MQFQPTTLILAASAQRELFDSARLDTARWDVAGFAAARGARPEAVAEHDHRVRRAVAGLLVRAAGVIEPRPQQRVAAHG